MSNAAIQGPAASTHEMRSRWDDGTVATATFDWTDAYRYLLTRTFLSECGSGVVTFIMLNPSTADALKNDPTVTRCCNYAKRWGFGSMEVVNLFALRATDPAELRQTSDPTGGEANDRYIEESCGRADLVVAAWGAHGNLKNRAWVVKHLLRPVATRVRALALTSGGEPRHPLYLRQDLQPVPFDVRGVA